jgi:hypothetical protein
LKSAKLRRVYPNRLTQEFKRSGEIAPVLQLPCDLQYPMDVSGSMGIVQKIPTRCTQMGSSFLSSPDTA